MKEENKKYNVKLVADSIEILEGECNKKEIEKIIDAFLQVFRDRITKDERRNRRR